MSWHQLFYNTYRHNRNPFPTDIGYIPRNVVYSGTGLDNLIEDQSGVYLYFSEQASYSVHKIDRTGSVIWSRQFPYHETEVPAVVGLFSDGGVAVLHAGHVYKLSGLNGGILWDYELSSDFYVNRAVYDSETDAVYALWLTWSLDYTYTARLSSAGQLIWQEALQRTSYYSIFVAERLYVFRGETILALSLESGSTLWERDISRPGTGGLASFEICAYDAEILYCLIAMLDPNTFVTNSFLQAYNASNGQLIWTSDSAGANIYYIRPIIFDDSVVAIAGATALLRRYSKQSGTLLQSKQFADRFINVAAGNSNSVLALVRGGSQGSQIIKQSINFNNDPIVVCKGDWASEDMSLIASDDGALFHCAWEYISICGRDMVVAYSRCTKFLVDAYTGTLVNL